MSEIALLLDEIRGMKRRLQALETVQEHPGFAASDVARLSIANTFADVNTFESDVIVEGDLTVDLDANITGDVLATGIVQAAAAWIPGVAVSLDAKLHCVFYGDEPYETDYTGNSHGHRGQASTESGGVIYRPGKFGKAVQVAEATTNLISNPSFENDVTTGWSFDGKTGGTRTQSSDAYYGSYSCKITSHTGPAGSYLAMWPSVSLVAYTTYVFSLWCKNVNLSLSPFFSIIDVGGGSVTLASGSFSPTNEWSRVQIQFTTGASVSDVRCYIRIGVNGGSFLIDGVQMEAKAYATPYCDGSLGSGHSWSGTAHASWSSRTAAYFSYSDLTGIRSSAWTIMWWMHSEVGFGESGAGTQYLLAFYATSSNRMVLYSQKLSNPTYTDGLWMEWVAGGGSPSYGSLFNGLLTRGSWHHVALVYSSGTMYQYANGVLRHTISRTEWTAQPSNLLIGKNIFGANYTAGVLWDDLAILSRALSADEIRAIYESQCQLICS